MTKEDWTVVYAGLSLIIPLIIIFAHAKGLI